jgi:YfiR/HmsC-like
MAPNRLAGHRGYWPGPFRTSPDGTRKPPGAKSGTRRRVDKSLASRVFLAVFRTFRDWKLWLLFLAAFHIATAPGFAQVSKEYQIKAVFLWRLAQFTEWPNTAFEHADSPTVICVLGENPFGDALEAAVRDETANGRKLLVQYHRAVQEIKTCHVLYISGSTVRQVKEISAAVAGRSILTVRDSDGPDRSYDAIVRFITEQSKIILRINVKAATAARLVLDPRLLRAAEIVGNE